MKMEKNGSGKSFEIVTHSSDETANVAKYAGEHISSGAVICLVGELGAGKTLFTQGLARGLGIERDVTSPTFNLMNIYHGRMDVFHFDLYRLEHERELDDIDFYAYVDEPMGVTIVEWADKFPRALPDDFIRVEIERANEHDENERRMIFSLVGNDGKLEKLFKEIEDNCLY